jgi:hypothetical protein
MRFAVKLEWAPVLRYRQPSEFADHCVSPVAV